MKKSTFYILSFTWGLPLTLAGLITSLALVCLRKKPKRWGGCWYFEIGKGWGGLEIGIVFLASKTASDHTKNHEHGHAIQNCYYGPLMPFIVCIPSCTRYLYRRIRKKLGYSNKTGYDDIWFEGQATRWGTEIVKAWEENER